MKNLLVAICALLALGISAAVFDANQDGIVLAQYGPPQAQDPDARWDRGDRDGEVRRFNREERGERRDDGDDRRGDRDGRRRDGDRDRYEGRPRRQCFTDDNGYRVCRN